MIKKKEKQTAPPTPVSVAGETKSHTSKHDQMNNDDDEEEKTNKEKNNNKTFQFSLGYLLLGFQLKTLEDFFMELFNYLYFTCQKKKKIKVTNIGCPCFY